MLAAAGPPGALSPSASAGQAAGLVLSAAAQGVGAQAAAAGAWLAEQGLQLNELGNLQEGPRPTLWTDRLRDATPADLAKSAWWADGRNRGPGDVGSGDVRSVLPPRGSCYRIAHIVHGMTK